MSPFDLALLFRTIWIAGTIGILATILAIPAAWALRRFGATGSALLLAPMLIPSHLVYSAWGLLRAPGTPLGDYFEQLGSDPDTGPSVWNLVHLWQAILALVLWAWPIAALVMSIWTRAIERDGIDAMRMLGAGRTRVCAQIMRMAAPGAALSVLLIGAMMIGSAVPLHLAQQRTYALVIWSEMTQGNVGDAWRASWPLFVLAAVAGIAMTIALVRGMDPSAWRGQGRDTKVHAIWPLAAGIVWCMSTLVPLGIVIWSVRDWGAVARFWSAAGDRAIASAETSLSTALICTVIALVCALGFASSAHRALRYTAMTLLALCSILFFIPGILIGASIAATNSLSNFLVGLTLAHVARFGLIAAIAGMLIGRAEPRELAEARRIFGRGWLGWLRTVARPQVGLIVGTLGAIALLSMHEIESAVLLAQAGHATLSQYMLDLLHFFRTDELLAALLWMQGLGIACAVTIAIITTRGGWGRIGQRAGRAAPLLLASLMLVGCDNASPGTDAQPLKVVRTIGETGRGPGQLVFPRTIDTDGRHLWVIDKTARVQRFGPEGSIGPSWTMPRQDRGRPCGITCGRDGLIYVADTHEHRIAIHRPTEGGGELVRAIGSYGTGPGQFIYPTDIAIAWNNDGITPKQFFVSEYGGNDRISVFDADWNFLFDIRGEDGLARPQSIAVDSERERLVVVDASHHRVGVFTLDGDLVQWFGQRDTFGPTFGEEPGAFSQPWGLALLGDGSALITEIGAQRVQNIDLDTGACLGVFGQGGWGEGELIQPWGITVIGELAYVLDSGKDRIVAFRHGRTPPTAPVALARQPLIGEDTTR